MLEDHYLISEVRIRLNDALRSLLKADLMTLPDFRACKEHVNAATTALDELIRITPK